MPACRVVFAHFALTASAIVSLAGCAATPMGPIVQAVPGPGKPFAVFQADQSDCRAFAADQVSGQVQASNHAAVGTAALSTVLGAGLGAAAGSFAGAAGTGAAIGAGLGAGGGAAIGASNSSSDQRGIQARYDAAYAQCMIARGEQVPGYGPSGYDPVRFAEPAPMAAPMPQPDPLVRATQTELNRLGYLGDAADGFAGPRTRTAISAYQQANAWPVDGAPSPRLLARLQATPTAAAAPGGWVAPASQGASVQPPATASAPGGWVSPAVAPTAAPTAAPVSAAAPASWVAPARSP
jgi:hypothetical protein